MEIDSLFKTFNINHANEIAHTGFLKAVINSNFLKGMDLINIKSLLSFKGRIFMARKLSIRLAP